MMDKVRRARTWYEEGQILFRKGEHEQSARAFTHAMRAGWDPETAHLSRGAANYLAGHYEEAVYDFSAVINRTGSNTRALYYRGAACMALGGYRRAIDDFTRVLDLEPEHGLAVFGRGISRAHTGDLDGAAADIRQAVMIAETDAQRFADTTGIWRNHFEGVLGVLHQHTDLSAADIEKLQGYFGV